MPTYEELERRRKQQIEAVKRNNKEHRKAFTLSLHKNNDADILRRFAEVGNVAGYIKKLVREDING